MYRHLLWAEIRPLTMQKGGRATGLKEIQLRPDAWKLATKAEVAVRKEGNSANSANPEGLENKFFTEFCFYIVRFLFILLLLLFLLLVFLSLFHLVPPSNSLERFVDLPR